MQLKSLVQFLEELAPLKYQEDYDNAGLIVGQPEMEITSVLISLDAIESVIDEAIAIGANVVVAHHPIIFRGLKKLNGKNYIERTIIKAIKNDIAIYAIHTNLDNVYINGVNSMICNKIGLTNTRILSPKMDVDPSGNIGSGMIGTLESPTEIKVFLNELKSKMELNTIKHTDLIKEAISTVAVCGGSGGFLLEAAKSAGADVFITSDYKYHEYFDANGEIIIIDIGHYESERFTIDLLQQLITQKFSNFATHSTKMVTNPINYY